LNPQNSTVTGERLTWVLFCRGGRQAADKQVCIVHRIVDVWSRHRSSTRAGGGGGDCRVCDVCGWATARFTITTEATTANDPDAVEQDPPNFV